MTVALASARAVRLAAEYPEVTRFLAAYWPGRETDDATALHAILCAARAGEVAGWRRALLVFLFASAEDAEKAAVIRASAGRRFQTERPEEAISWLRTMVVALVDIEGYLAQ